MGILIRGGTVVTATDTYRGDVLIEGETISTIGVNIDASTSLDDIIALRELVPLGVEGAIIGKALYSGAFTLPEALDVAGR